MSLQAFLRAPFSAPTQGNAFDFQVVAEFGDAGSLALQLQQVGAANIALQPVFPGKLTFKPDPGQLIPADPTKLTGALTGQLFLECTSSDLIDWLNSQLPGCRYPLLFVYSGVSLGATFFAQLATDTGNLKFDTLTLERASAPVKPADKKAQRIQAINDFANGKLSVNLPLASLAQGDLPWFAFVPVTTSGTSIDVKFSCGIRIYADPYARPQALAEMQCAEIATANHFAPLPLPFLFNQLRAAAGWADAAAPNHADHPFFVFLGTLEDPATQGRWRDVRCQPSSAPGDTPNAVPSLLGAMVRGFDAGQNELWHVAANALGDAYVKRTDTEQFRVSVEIDQVPQSIVIANSATPPATMIDYQWPAATGADNGQRLSLEVDAVPTADILTNPVPTLQIGVVDQGGYTVDTINRVVLDTREWVRVTRTTLTGLGFTLANPANPPPFDPRTFDLQLSWAVREFQIYATYATVAAVGSTNAVYTDSLIPAANAQPYAGSINGMLDGPTAAALVTWQKNGYRCPVVVQSWSVAHNGQRRALAKDNIWLYTDDPTSANRAFVRDLSGFYTLPPSHANDPLIVLGKYVQTPYGSGVLSETATNTTWKPDTAITPVLLVGRPLQAPAGTTPADAVTISTYKAILGVARAEAEGIFDVFNGYDRGVISMGVFHWTICLVANQVNGPSELPAYLAYLKQAAAADYKKFFGTFGIDVQKDWTDVKSLYEKTQVKWQGIVRQAGLRRKNAVDPNAIPLIRGDESDYFRTWHWLYRFTMACRTSTAFQQRQWDMARLRVQALLAAPWGDVHPFFGANAKLGQIYSSERAVTALIRAHVNAPASVIDARGKKGAVHARIRAAYAAAQVSNDDPTKWTAQDITHVHAQLESTLTHFNTPISQTLWIALGDPDPNHPNRPPPVLQFGPLSTDVNSFLFDDTGLPA